MLELKPMRPCPHCSREIKDDVELCKWCGGPVAPGATDAPGREREDAVRQARAAHAGGARLFQIALPLSVTTGFAEVMGPTYATARTGEHGTVLDAIEGEGWNLNHADYVFRMLGSVSRDKFLSSGQREAVSGEIVGVYIFRRQ
jgi:hypothetical protein